MHSTRNISVFPFQVVKLGWLHDVALLDGAYLACGSMSYLRHGP
jgi:hypothetical protein